MSLLPILRPTQRPTTQGHSRHAKHENSWKIEHIGLITFKGSTNLGLGLPTEDAKARLPLIEAVSFAESLR